ncbi:uncharacterized protein [Rutidosis leptorrhynchoides]|uniref:uncharacterized protein n=1 Tax=Rutidosis leptorrhynchoides TaxID=125765 RepID=UPI003A98E144
MSMKMCYSYQIHDRLNVYSLMLRAGRLFQQYVVTVYCSIELDRMDYIRRKQKYIRNEYLSSLYDAISRGDQTGSDVGSRTILPASFTGGTHYLYSHYLDALAICQEHKLLGDFRGVLYTIEFQKRGLPHCHILLWLHSATSTPITERLDNYISAELPDPRTDPAGYAVISATMMHGPRGKEKPRAPCMEAFTCKKKFSKKYNEKTFSDTDGPHINVECCGSTTLIKYLFKYISNSTDRVAARISKPVGSGSQKAPETSQSVDEIQNFIDARFICSHEACWRIFNFPIHNRELAVQKANMKKPSIGRISYIHPAYGEAFFLRMLLCHQKGCQSFEDVKTVNKALHGTYRSACEAAGLLGDDKEWATALEEASANPVELWENHWKLMSDDIPLRAASTLNMSALHINEEDMHYYVLFEVEPELVFVYGHGGMGKTFLWKSIITALRVRGKMYWPWHRSMAKLIDSTDLIVWDEAPMNSKRCFKALTGA